MGVDAFRRGVRTREQHAPTLNSERGYKAAAAESSRRARAAGAGATMDRARARSKRQRKMAPCMTANEMMTKRSAI
eukprot:3711337-Pyramimonas_sp.AAC.1